MNPKAIAAWVLGGGVGVTILAFAMQFWISLVVSSQLSAAGIVPAHEVVAIKKDVKENTTDIDDIEDRWNRLVDALAAENNGN